MRNPASIFRRQRSGPRSSPDAQRFARGDRSVADLIAPAAIEETRAQLARWARHFATQGSDAFTAERQAMAMLYRETVAQAQLLAYADDFWLLALLFAAVPLLLPFMRRIRLPSKSDGEQASDPARARAVGEGVA